MGGTVHVAVAVAEGLGEEVFVAVGAGGCVGIEVATALGGAGRCIGIALGTGLGGAGREIVGEGKAAGLSRARDVGEGWIGEGMGLGEGGRGVGGVGTAVGSGFLTGIGVGEGSGRAAVGAGAGASIRAVGSGFFAAVGVGDGAGRAAAGAGVGASICGQGVGVSRRATTTRGPHATAAAPATARQARVQAEGLIFISLYGSRSESLPSDRLVRSDVFPEGHRTVTRSATFRLPSPK